MDKPESRVTSRTRAASVEVPSIIAQWASSAAALGYNAGQGNGDEARFAGAPLASCAVASPSEPQRADVLAAAQRAEVQATLCAGLVDTHARNPQELARGLTALADAPAYAETYDRMRLLLRDHDGRSVQAYLPLNVEQQHSLGVRSPRAAVHGWGQTEPGLQPVRCVQLSEVATNNSGAVADVLASGLLLVVTCPTGAFALPAANRRLIELFGISGSDALLFLPIRVPPTDRHPNGDDAGGASSGGAVAGALMVSLPSERLASLQASDILGLSLVTQCLGTALGIQQKLEDRTPANGSFGQQPSGPLSLAHRLADLMLVLDQGQAASLGRLLTHSPALGDAVVGHLAKAAPHANAQRLPP